MPHPPGSRREAILEAALDCFTSYGFAKTTMDDIRVRAGASTGSLYHHFKSKEQLAAELYVEGVRRYQQGLTRELGRHQSAEAGVRGVVRDYLRWIERHPKWARYLLHSRQAELVAQTEPAMRELNQSMNREFADWVRPFVEAGDVLDLPGDLYVALLIGPVQAYARMRQSGRARTDLATAREVLGEAAWKSVRVERGSQR